MCIRDSALFEAKAFGPFLVIRTKDATLTPEAYLYAATRAMLVGRSLGIGDTDINLATLEKAKNAIGFESLQWDDQIGKVSLVGAAMRSHPGVSATFFEALADAGVNVELISTSEIRISVVCREDAVDDAVRAVHSAFGLDVDGTEAVVYGGTGR